ncbi:hypothetical protein XELAEV_18029916mg [Xenopus laevis]|uniref:Uncharacterized protein n=1 Tax=Xenopus laevis TaxID=8355 RepID=A0A974HII1_XENLA|nr:hypothetical protein XELAEV_18029916mg [Xenopus laevis]
MASHQICTHHENCTSLSDATNNASPSLEGQEYSPASSPHRVEGRGDTIWLLLHHGADPSRCRVPVHALFFAIKAAYVSIVQLLLERGAQTDIQLVTKHGTITPLHLAVTLPGAEGIRITELLLHAALTPMLEQETKITYMNMNMTGRHTMGIKPLLDFSLAVESGNYQAVKELLGNGADPNLPLSRGVGSALCAAVNNDYEKGRTSLERIAMIG